MFSFVAKTTKYIRAFNNLIYILFSLGLSSRFLPTLRGFEGFDILIVM